MHRRKCAQIVKWCLKSGETDIHKIFPSHDHCLYRSQSYSTGTYIQFGDAITRPVMTWYGMTSLQFKYGLSCFQIHFFKPVINPNGWNLHVHTHLCICTHIHTLLCIGEVPVSITSLGKGVDIIFNKIIPKISSKNIHKINPKVALVRVVMITSSNGNIFRVTGHLCGEFTGRRWIPRTKASDAELWWSALNKRLNKQW